MLNRSASLAMSTSVLKALPGKLDIKGHSPSILYVTVTEDDIAVVSTDCKKLHFLDISDPSSASVQRSVSLGYTALGITTYKDKLVVTACTTPPSVRMIDTNGKEIWSVSKGLDNEQLFVTPCFIVASKINDT